MQALSDRGYAVTGLDRSVDIASAAATIAPSGSGSTQITLFQLAGEWQRSDVELWERCHDPETVRALLARAGFVDGVEHDAATDLGMTGPLATGRHLPVAHRGAAAGHDGARTRHCEGASVVTAPTVPA